MKTCILAFLLTTIAPCMIVGSEQHEIKLITKLIPFIINKAEAESELISKSRMLHQKAFPLDTEQVDRANLSAITLEIEIMRLKRALEYIKKIR